MEFSAVAAFPGLTTCGERLVFESPREVVVAETLDDVRGALARVDEAARRGKWAVGFVAYDAAPAFDPALEVPARDGGGPPLMCFGVFDAPQGPAGRRRLEKSKAREWTPHASRNHYSSTVERIRRGIRDGEFYQVNHTLRLRATIGRAAADPASIGCIFDEMRAAQPRSYAMEFYVGQWAILSVSPELFFERVGNAIATRPMKGTMPRGRWPAEDARLRAELAASEKDRAENVMIVDLIRNDLGRIAKTGTVDVPRLFEIEEHPTVWQMTSTVTATLRDDAALTDIFGALFPCGSVVGAPKIAAAKFIARNECAPRGVYCGAIGIIKPGGDCTFNVAIRTLVVNRATGAAEYGAGGGITIDSTPIGEYDELLAKAAVLNGVPTNFGLIETLRLSEGAFVRRDRHVRRIVESAKHFGFGDVAGVADSLLDEQARRTPTGDYRVRLVIDPATASRVDVEPIAPRSFLSPKLSCVIARTPVSSRDRLLFHKTTNRAAYDARRAESPHVDEVILVNERGELTECTIGNLVVELDGVRCTPPLDCGLLPGIFRDELLERGEIVERVLRAEDLAVATGIWRVNSLREWVGLRMEG